jgi:hypothetical protein
MRKQSYLRNLIASASRVRLSRLLIAAAILHLSLAIAMQVAGRYRLFPNIFNSEGVGISFAADSIAYLKYSDALVHIFEREGISAWLKFDLPLHVKLYSLSYAVTGRVLGRTTLSVEPLNLFYYLLLLALVFALGREVFDRATGILAAVITGLWPSLLLHTTQLLRDPLFLITFLIIILTCISWLTRTYSWQGGLLWGIAGGVASALLWLVRSQMWEVILCAALLSTAFLLIRQFRERRLVVGNLIGAAILCSIMIAAPVAGKAFNLYSYPSEQSRPADSQKSSAGSETTAPADNRPASPASPTLPPGSPLPARVGFLRHKFLLLYPGAGSNIDTDVELNSLSDILLYLPRAIMIGLFAPFPNMWFVTGSQAGIEARLLSGLETLLIYLIEALAAFALWHRRAHLPSWLLLLISLTGLLALGLVVPNLAALYRMRYGFWLLLIILGAEGLRQVSLQHSPTGKQHR